MTKNNFYDIHTLAQPESERARKYECLFMCAVNDPNYDERTNNNAHKTQQRQQQLDLLWRKVSTRTSWDVWRKVLTIIFVHSVCQQQQQQQLRCIFDYLYTLQCSLAHLGFYFPVFSRWIDFYVRMHVEKALEIYTLNSFVFHSFVDSSGEFPNESHHYSTFLRNFLLACLSSLTWKFLHRKFIQ